MDISTISEPQKVVLLTMSERGHTSIDKTSTLKRKLTQDGIGVKGVLSARRCICRTTMVTTMAKTHRQMTNTKYTTTNMPHYIALAGLLNVDGLLVPF